MKRLFVLMLLFTFAINIWTFDVIVNAIACDLSNGDMVADVTEKYCDYGTDKNIPSSVKNIGKDAVIFGNCGVNGDNVKWIYYADSEKLVLDGEGEMMNYSYRECPWSSFTESIKSIEIHSGVTSLGDFSFSDCWNLKSINIPNTVTRIGRQALSGTDIESVNIPNSVLSIESGAFYMSSLTTMSIGNSVKDIGPSAFQFCVKLTSVNLPNSLVEIGRYAFYRCFSLDSITVPNSVTNIGDSAFFDCHHLRKVVLSNSDLAIGKDVFAGCGLLESVGPLKSNCSIEYGWNRSIPNYAFSNVPNLQKIYIPSEINKIGDYAFSNASKETPSIKEIYTHAVNPPSISSMTFYSVSALSRVLVPRNSKQLYLKAPFWEKFNIVEQIDVESDYTNCSIQIDESIAVNFTILPIESTYKDLQWKIEDEEIATVNDGIVKGLKAGTTELSVTTTDGTNISASCQITVCKWPQTITWNQKISNCQRGGEMIVLEAKSSSALPVTFTSSDENIISIYDLGDMVYANPVNCGTAYITAYQEGNYKYEPVNIKRKIEVEGTPLTTSRTLVVYYSQSSIIDGIVVELANQISASNISVNLQKIEPTNPRINEANSNSEVRDSIMNIISLYPNDESCYPDIKPMTLDVNDYDVIILIYPLWNDAMAAPMQTFRMIYQHSYKSKELGYIEYDEQNNSDSSSNSKVLRICSNDTENVNELINEWLNNNDPTGIKVICSQNNIRHRGIYDLQGRKLIKSPSHGVYIENGVKVAKKQ